MKFVVTYQKLVVVEQEANNMAEAAAIAERVLNQYAKGSVKILSIYADNYVEPTKAEEEQKKPFTKAEMMNLNLRANVRKLLGPPTDGESA